MKEEKWYHQKRFDNNNVIAVTKNLLHHLSVPVTNIYLTNSIKEHQNSATIASISSLLDRLKINNMTVHITTDDLNEIAYPAIAQIEKNNYGYFVMLLGAKNNQVKYIEPELGWITESFDDFKKKWTGIVLMADAEGSTGEKNYAKKRMRERLTNLKIPLMIVGITVLLGLSMASGVRSYPLFVGNWLPVFLIKLAGVAISILLLIKTIDSQNPLVNKICNLGLKKSKLNCSSVLNSSSAKLLYGLLSWSEIGFFYFTGSFLALVFMLFSNSFDSVWLVLTVINLLALPYTLYSITYQAFTKQWCTLCTAIQVLLWLEFIFLFQSGIFRGLPGFDLTAFNCIAWGFLLPVLFWVVVKPRLVKSQAVEPLKDKLNKFIKNPKLLNTMLVNSKKVETSVFSNEIIVGDPESKTVVTMVISMYCGPCGSAFKYINELVEEYNDIKVVIRFSVKAEDDDRDTNDIVKFILAATFERNREEIIILINDWYEKGNRDFKSWVKNNPLKDQGNLKKATPLLDAHINYCKEAVIKKTPTIYINNYEMPEGFYAGDIPYFLESV